MTNEGKVVLSSETTGTLAASVDSIDLRKSAEQTLAAQAEKMVAGESGMSTVTVDGTDYYLAYTPIPSIGWSVGTLKKASEVIEPARESWAVVMAQAENFAATMGVFFKENLWRMIGSLLVILVVLPAVSRFAAKRFVKPILVLTDGVEEIARGNLDKKLQITTGDELQTLSNSVNNMTDEYMTNLAQVTAEKQHIATELSLARGIQEGMLPKIFPKITESGGIELFAVMESAKSVGGDFYDFYALDKEHIAITMADVSGKGVPAALFTEFGVNKSRALLVYDYYHSERCLSICWYKLFRILERCEGYEEKRKDIA